MNTSDWQVSTPPPSSPQDRRQCTFVGVVDGRKVSITRHLHFVNGAWWGVPLTGNVWIPRAHVELQWVRNQKKGLPKRGSFAGGGLVKYFGDEVDSVTPPPAPYPASGEGELMAVAA